LQQSNFQSGNYDDYYNVRNNYGYSGSPLMGDLNARITRDA
jgi:hypothetical protein